MGQCKIYIQVSVQDKDLEDLQKRIKPVYEYVDMHSNDADGFLELE